jgi:outer membrane lipoprotein-sorting protein
MGINPMRRVWLGVALIAGTAVLVVVPALAKNQQLARAEEIRSRCVRELSSKRSWHAVIVETETGSDGKREVVRQDLLVRRPGQYRLTVRETDDKGRPVVATTVRDRSGVYTHRTNADGSTEMHIVRGVRPSLGVEFDNLIGQTVQAVGEAKPLGIVGRETRAGRAVDKLALGADRYVWVDQESGIPVGEQVLSGSTVAHDITVAQFEDGAPAPDSEFSAASLGSADTTITEDLGFREASATLAQPVIGFAPCDVPALPGYTADTSGYTDPRSKTGEGPVEAAYITAFSNGTSGVIVTQVLRPGAGEFLASGSSSADGAEKVDLDGTTGLYYADAAHPQLVFVRRDILVTVEGNLPLSAMMDLAQGIR